MKKKTLVASFGLMVSSLTFAGGLLTNTNQNVAFLRNPARDGAIGIDGVYSNPAGVAFLPDGLHLSLNFQSAYQTREITSVFGPFAYGAGNRGESSKLFKGDAKAPVVPSLQAAYIRGRWSYSFNFAIGGGGGKCAFEDGLGSFESQAALFRCWGARWASTAILSTAICAAASIISVSKSVRPIKSPTICRLLSADGWCMPPRTTTVM